jgi:hypothetical protein
MVPRPSIRVFPAYPLLSFQFILHPVTTYPSQNVCRSSLRVCSNHHQPILHSVSRPTLCLAHPSLFDFHFFYYNVFSLSIIVRSVKSMKSIHQSVFSLFISECSVRLFWWIQSIDHGVLYLTTWVARLFATPAKIPQSGGPGDSPPRAGGHVLLVVPPGRHTSGAVPRTPAQWAVSERDTSSVPTCWWRLHHAAYILDSTAGCSGAPKRRFSRLVGPFPRCSQAVGGQTAHE